MDFFVWSAAVCTFVYIIVKGAHQRRAQQPPTDNREAIELRRKLSKDRDEVYRNEYKPFVQALNAKGVKVVSPALFDQTLSSYFCYFAQEASWKSGEETQKTEEINKLMSTLSNQTRPGDLLIIDFKCDYTMRVISVRLHIPREDVYKFAIAHSNAYTRFKDIIPPYTVSEKPRLDVQLVAALQLMRDPTLDEASMKKLLNL